MVVVVVLTLYVFTYHDDMRSNYKRIKFQVDIISKWLLVFSFQICLSPNSVNVGARIIIFEKSANSCQETRFETHKATFNTKFVTITTNNNIMVITAIETSLQKKSLVK